MGALGISVRETWSRVCGEQGDRQPAGGADCCPAAEEALWGQRGFDSLRKSEIQILCMLQSPTSVCTKPESSFSAVCFWKLWSLGSSGGWSQLQVTVFLSSSGFTLFLITWSPRLALPGLSGSTGLPTLAAHLLLLSSLGYLGVHCGFSLQNFIWTELPLDLPLVAVSDVQVFPGGPICMCPEVAGTHACSSCSCGLTSSWI